MNAMNSNGIPLRQGLMNLHQFIFPGVVFSETICLFIEK